MNEQILTFSAICQVAELVQKLSKTGTIADEDFSILLNSLLELSPENTLAVYGGDVNNLKAGLRLFTNHLGDSSSKNKAAKDPELTRYIISLINLERRLVKNNKQMLSLAQRLEDTKRQLTHYTITSPQLLASFASIYSDIISPLGARIQVTGEPNILKQPNNQDKIRALLLAGIRAAVLWRQVGGKRRDIIFRRKKMVFQAEQILASL